MARQTKKRGRLTRDDLDAIFTEYYPKLFNYVYYRTLNRDLADDVTSNSMVRIVRNYEQFDPERGELGAWVYRIARNELYSYYRKAREETDIDAIPEGVFATTDEDIEKLGEEGVDVRALLAVLTDEERELVYLKFWEELSNKEIAERVGMNASTVSTKLWRANDKMRKAMPKQ